MSERTVVVAAANETYFGFLKDLLHSFVACGAANRYDFAVLDVGLAAESTAWLRSFGIGTIVRPDWPVTGMEAQPEWYKALVCRPFLPNHFGAWDCIVSVDADSWFQTIEAIELAEAGAREDGFAVVPMVERAHWHPSDTASTIASANWQKESLTQGFGEEVAQRLANHPIIACGFFAGRARAPHWSSWQQLLVQALRRRIYFSAEQAALNVMVHQTGIPVHYLPNYCHWVCHVGTLGLDARTGTYVEPDLPRHPISVLGLAAHTKAQPVLVRTSDGRTLRRLLRFGQQQSPIALEVTIHGATHSFDGIASPRFRELAFDAIGRSTPARFVQIGAMDGVSFDPIHDHVRRHGWRGLLVEPLPDLMDRLQSNYAGVPGLSFAQVAIAEQTGRQPMQRVRAEAVANRVLPAWAAGISSLVPERNVLGGKTLTPEQGAAVKREVETVEVDCLSFADLEARHGVAGMDMLQIDAEGYDWRILRQVDLQRHAPACIHAEIVCLPPDEIDAMTVHLHKADYVCYVMADGENLLAVRRDFGALLFGIL